MSMNIAVLGCIHGDIEAIMKFLDKMSVLSIDAIVCPGDFTDYAVPKGFSRTDIVRIILEELKSLHAPIITVPGSWDKDVIEFLKKESISVHGEGKVIDGVGFYGYGGARTPFKTPFEPAEGEIMLGLENAFGEVKRADIKIQVTHVPPFNTKIDLIPTGAHVGSLAVREFIEANQPDAAVCAHIHESSGVDIIKGTKVINSGRFPEGYFGLVSVDDGKVDVKLSNLI
ncbi:MAG: metallophosphoesterase [Candidatus Aenigmarchaeota archaeon]|nr:metallophosphoesterase [Candidatus Aenigmarchaeota archaeon]